MFTKTFNPSGWNFRVLSIVMWSEWDRFLLLTRKLIVRKWMFWIEWQYVSKAHVYNLKSLNNQNNLHTMPQATFKKIPISVSVLCKLVYCKRHALVHVVKLRNFTSYYFCLACRTFSAMVGETRTLSGINGNSGLSTVKARRGGWDSMKISWFLILLRSTKALWQVQVWGPCKT